MKLSKRSIFRVSVKDMINSRSRVVDNGIEGYFIPKYNAHLDKPYKPFITKSSKNDFLSAIQKREKSMPSPG